MERHGYRSGLAERLREEYESRVQVRQERAAAQTPADHAMRTLTLEEIRRQARESWLRMRQESKDGPRLGGKDDAVNRSDRALDDDLAR
jgi:hypothetical protein